METVISPASRKSVKRKAIPVAQDEMAEGVEMMGTVDDDDDASSSKKQKESNGESDLFADDEDIGVSVKVSS